MPIEVFRWIDEVTGDTVTLLSQELRAWCRANTHKLLIHTVPIMFAQIQIIVDSRGIIPDRVRALTAEERKDPIIYIRFGISEPPDVVLADGRHRYMRAVIEGDKTICAYLLEEHQWRPFQIHLDDNMTKEQLIVTPVGHLKRN